MGLSALLVLLLSSTFFAQTSYALFDADPTVTISSPSATIVGSTPGFIQQLDGSAIDTFNGIPFAQPPIGQLRLKPPQPLSAPLGTIIATDTAIACPQFIMQTSLPDSLEGIASSLLTSPLYQKATSQGEDCLTLDIQRPAGITSSSKLPVLLWIYGGGFELGSTQIFTGSSFVAHSIAEGKPVLFAQMNYRVGGFGFMPGAEILADGSANLGLLDQRLAMQWVADNIEAFGGDPEKVTIWGESAGAISVFDQMVLYDGNITYKGKPLFRGAIMNSGSAIPSDNVDCPKGQQVYDTVVQSAGCQQAADTLACLRSADYETFLNATNSVPPILGFHSVALSYLPRPDGIIYTKSPEVLGQTKKVAQVPFIIGSQEDEGTAFALFQNNLTTTQDIVDYLATLYFSNATLAQIQTLVGNYPDDPTAGSPFGTGNDNNWYPQFKRLAAILGDVTFTMPRRGVLNVSATIHPDVPTWSFIDTYGAGNPILGTFHGSDTVQLIAPELANNILQTMQLYYFNFLYNLDPNDAGSNLETWPQWSEEGNMLMNFQNNGTALLADDFRQQSFEFLLANSQSFRF